MKSKWNLVALVLIVVLGGVVWGVYFLMAEEAGTGGDSGVPWSVSSSAGSVRSGQDEGGANALGDGSEKSSVSEPSSAGVPPRRAYMLSAEKAFLRGGELSVDAVVNIIHDDKFKKAIGELGLEAASDPDALELQRLYTNEIRNMVETYDSLRLMEFSCGMSLCMGIVRGVGDSDNEYDAWKASLDDPASIKTYSFVDGVINLTTDQTDYRFLFSVDSSVAGLHSVVRPGGF